MYVWGKKIHPYISKRAELKTRYWEDPEGLGREGGGREDRDGEYM